MQPTTASISGARRGWARLGTSEMTKAAKLPRSRSTQARVSSPSPQAENGMVRTPAPVRLLSSDVTHRGGTANGEEFLPERTSAEN